MVIEMQLYLDTHPYDRDALMKFNTLATQAKMLRQTYESMYGPLTANVPMSYCPWPWINNPWPWDYEFNFRLAGEE